MKIGNCKNLSANFIKVPSWMFETALNMPSEIPHSLSLRSWQKNPLNKKSNALEILRYLVAAKRCHMTTRTSRITSLLQFKNDPTVFLWA